MVYETFLQPGLALFGVLAALIVLLKGRTKVEVEKFGTTVTETRLRTGAFKQFAALVVATALIVPALAVVPAGHRGVVYSAAGGISEVERPEGFSVVVPLLQHVYSMNVRTQRFFTDKAFAQTKDLQEVTLVVSVNYHVVPDQAAELYRAVGTGFSETVVAPAVLQLVKERVGLVEAADFAAQRAVLASDIRSALGLQLEGYGIAVEYVNIEDAIFDPAFIQAVKDKVIADQEAAEQRRLIDAINAQREQAILQAEGRAASILIEATAQAEANSLVAATLTLDLLTWREIVQWDGVVPLTYITGGEAQVLVGPIE